MYPDTNEIERRIEERTAELSQANALLQKEIENRKLAEEQIQFQAAILSRVSDAIIAINSQNCITYWNKAAERLYEYKAEEVLGRSLEEVNHYRWLEGEDEQTAYTALLTRGIWQGENIHRKKNGEEIYVESSVSILTDNNGVSNGFLAVVRDITERKQAEQKISQQADLLNIATDAILVCNLKNQILFWNKGAEHLYEWQAAEVLGKNANQLLYKEISPQLEEAVLAVVEHGSWQGELNQVLKDSKSIIVQSRWTLVRDKTGQPQSILIVNTDITEKKQLEAQFFRTQRLESLGTLASGIAHDFNNILTPILIVAQLLSHKCFALDKENQQLLKTVEDSSKRGAILVKQILSFAQGSEGDRVYIQVKHMLKEIEQIVKSTFPKSIEININRLMENLWTIWADPTQLHQVLLNLCVNARDAMPNGGTLSLSAENVIVNENDARMNLDAKVGSFVAISVSDTGCGISPEIQERIFDPFFTTKEKSRGTGLGLSTVLGIVKNHGGFVKVYSQLGKGSQFQVYLPASGTQVTQEAADIRMPRGNSELILIVDDEEHIREATKTSLENYNYKILTASDALEAFSIFKQRRDDIKLVLMDIQMPLMDGLNAARILQKINPSVKIIATGGLFCNQKLLEASDIGVKAFLLKPYTIQELLDTTKRVLSAP